MTKPLHIPFDLFYEGVTTFYEKTIPGAFEKLLEKRPERYKKKHFSKNSCFKIVYSAICYQLFLNYKRSPFKWKSGYKFEQGKKNTFWISYTLNDVNTPQKMNVTFKLHYKRGHYRKKRIALLTLYKNGNKN
jgi:hypothetical protein